MDDTINRRLDRLIRASGLKQVEISRRSGVNENTISAIVNLRREVRAEEAANIATAIGQPLESLYGGRTWDRTWHVIPDYTVNRNVRRRMEKKGITQRQLAETMGWPEWLIQDIAICRRTVTAAEAADLAKALWVPLRELFREVEEDD